MATEKNFKVKKGLDVKSGVVTVENAPTSNAADLVVLKDGTNEIGKIKYSATDNLAIYASATDHAGINFIESAIIPMSAGTETNDAISLGDSTRAFKDLYLSGDLNVAGAINSTSTSATNLEIEDITITLNKSDSDSSSAANGAGIVIQDAVDASTDASILWNTTNDEFDFSNGITVNGDISLPDHITEVTGENAVAEDSAKIKLGASDDLTIYHDSAGGNRIDSDGHLRINTFNAGNEVIIVDKSTATAKTVAAFGRNGNLNPSVRLYEDGNIQVELSSGVTRFYGDVRIEDGNDFTNITPTVDTGIKGQALKYGDANKAILQFDAPAWTLFTGHDPDGAGAGAAIDAELLRMTAGGNFGVGTFADGAEPTHHLHLLSTTANTNTAEDIVKIESKSSNTTAAGFGANILFNAERADGAQQDQGRIGFIANTNTGTVLSSDFVISTATDGTITDKVWVKDDGRVGLGNSSPDADARLHISHSLPRIIFQDSDGTNQKGMFEQSGATLGLISQNNTTNGAIQFRGFNGTTTVNYAGFDSSGVLTLGDIVFPTAKGTAGQSLVMNAGATALEFGTPAVDNITKDNTSVAITDNGTDAGSITATVDGTAIAVIDGDGITVTGDVEASEFIGDVRGAVLFKAKASENLAKGDVVYIDQYEANGNQTKVAKANASDAAKMPAFGIVAAAANANANVNVYTFGTLSGLDTSSFSVNDELYVSATTAGALVDTAPAGSANLIQKIAKVLRSDGSAGSIKIMGAGRTNATPNLDEGKIFVGNASNKSVQVDDTITVDMANDKVDVVGDVKLPEGGGYYVQETAKRDSNNVAYAAGDAAGFEHKDSVKLYSVSDESVLDLFETKSDGSGGFIRRHSSRIRSGGNSYFLRPANFGIVAGTSQVSIKPIADSNNKHHIAFYSDNSNTGANNGTIGYIKSRENATTDTTSSLEIVLSRLVGSTITDNIILSADPDTTSSIGGDLDVVGTFTAGNIASDAKIATGSYILPNAIGTAGQVLAYPDAGTELEWVTRGVDFDEVPSAMQTLARTMGWVPGYNNNVESSAIWNIDENALEFTTEASASTGVVHKAFFVRAGESINVSLPIKGDTTAGNAGVSILLYQYLATSTLPAGKTHVVDSASYSTAQQAAAGHAGGDTGYDANSGNWQTFSISQASVDEDTWISISVTVTSSYINGGIRKLYLKDPHIEVSSATKQDMIALQYIFG